MALASKRCHLKVKPRAAQTLRLSSDLCKFTTLRPPILLAPHFRSRFHLGAPLPTIDAVNISLYLRLRFTVLIEENAEIRHCCKPQICDRVVARLDRETENRRAAPCYRKRTNPTYTYL